MKHSILSILLGGLVLSGCGGHDKNNPQSDTPEPIQSNLNTSTAKATFANTVPPQTTTKIKEIVSPVGTSLVSNNNLASLMDTQRQKHKHHGK